MSKFFLILLSVLIVGCASKTTPATSRGGKKVGKTVAIKDKNIDWEAFDNSSTLAATAIKTEHLQGLWKAYKGEYRFGEHVNAMTLSTPMIIEVQGATYRRNAKSDFETFSVTNNIITKKTASSSEVGVINKITSTELTISWKNKDNYTRYYYKK